MLWLGIGTFILLKCTQGAVSSSSNPAPIPAWGLDAGFLLLVITHTISIWKPSALPRYYFVLMPACIGVISCWLGSHIQPKDLLRWRGALLTGLMIILLSLFWQDSFLGIAPDQPYVQRNDSNYRTLSLNSATDNIKLTRQCRELNASDYILRQGRLLSPGPIWTCIHDASLPKLTAELQPGEEIVMAISKTSMIRKQHLQQDAQAPETMGFSCSQPKMIQPASQLIRCGR
ncbi:hypothetical protein PMIT1342_02390 [Prochlorococcus marinus str. MIT 1342]|nr:hypothetical protein PMIT1342_02390 [Prochlorococcus marinus str. MIT 1342]